MAWIERGGAIALSRQCELAGVARASVSRRTVEPVGTSIQVQSST
jgi:hypothetical protein